jgi:rhodanese-related sulfurtransferase
MTEEEFVKEVLTGLTKPPQYFPKNAMMNKKVNTDFDSIVSMGTVALNPNEFETLVEDGALMLDVRTQHDFIKEHVPGSIFIGLNGNFAPWVGALITDINQRIVLVVDEGKEEEAVTRLSRIGYDNSVGYLKGGIEAWKADGREVDSIQKVSPADFEKAVADNASVLDVRKPSEFEAEHVDGAENIPLDYINDNMSQINPDKTYYVHCLGGYRSVIFESILKSRGYHNIIDVDRGFKAIKDETSLKITDFVCQSKS